MQQTPNDVAFRALVKAVVFMTISPAIIFLAYAVFSVITLPDMLIALGGVIFMSTALIRPYLVNLQRLTQYVDDLAQDRRVEMPSMAIFSSITNLPSALNRLHLSWERRKQQMEAIIDEREILVDSIPDILIMVDSSLTIVRTNAAARQNFGQNLAHRKLEEVVRNSVLIRAVREAYEAGEDKDVEFVLTKPVEGYFRARIDHFPVRSSGGIAVIITIHDITELKRTEQMRADFVANASHEIRTPLASLIGFIETLQGPAKNDEKAREQFLSIMDEQARRMAALVNDLLSLSKIEMNASTLPTEAVDVLRIIGSVKEHNEWAANHKRMVVRTQLPESLPYVRGEESELMQVVQNLVSNAIKYGREETEVVVRAELAQRCPYDRQLQMRPPVVKISVQDHGEGIAKEHIPRLTERFYRVNTATSRKVGGTGLGLAIVKHILARHRALLEIESEVGLGSTFSIYLPLRQELEPRYEA